MSGAYVVHALRTAVMPHGGAFAGLRVEDLGAPVVRALLEATGIAPDQVDEAICSNALGEGGNPARRIALAAGLPDRVAGLTTDRQCAGGLDALLLARALVVSGMARVVVAGGVESWSRRPERRMPGAAEPYLQAPFTPWPDRDPDMAEAAAALSTRLGTSRAAQDAWAVDSHRKALAADLSPEIVPVAGVTRDPFARSLTPAIAARAKVLTGPITAANAAVAADGAAFALVVAPDIAARFAPACRLTGVTRGGVPWEPGTAPGYHALTQGYLVSRGPGWTPPLSTPKGVPWRAAIPLARRAQCWRCGCFTAWPPGQGWALPPSRRRAGSGRRWCWSSSAALPERAGGQPPAPPGIFRERGRQKGPSSRGLLRPATAGRRGA